ncbi:MAG: hypothetical protein AB9922_07475 [Bacteroidales bacterium]
MKRSKIKEALGFRYIYNPGTKEIHFVKTMTSQCGLQNMTRGRYCTFLFAAMLMAYRNYNGCAHCLPLRDTDKK